MKFVEICIAAGDKAALSSNITAGYCATGFYPINPSVIPDATFALSLLTHIEVPQISNVVTQI
jgi:hypothetical protein